MNDSLRVTHGWMSRGLGRGVLPMLRAALAIALVQLPVGSMADVHDVTVADVTPRAFSVVWMSDDPVVDATIRVFVDPDGVDEITDQLEIALISERYAPAHAQGIVKVDVVGLEPDSIYYFEIQTTTGAGVVYYPSSGAGLAGASVTTASAVAVAAADDVPIANDVLYRDIYEPDGVTPSEGTLLMVSAPDLSPYPVSAFVDAADSEAPMALADLNNLFGADGRTVQVGDGVLIELTELRGRVPGSEGVVCDASNHKLAFWRLTPAGDDGPVITEIRSPAPCFSPDGIPADFDCDDRVGLVDFARFSAGYSLERPDCRFHPDLDLDGDGRIGLLDFSQLSSVYGAEQQ